MLLFKDNSTNNGYLVHFNQRKDTPNLPSNQAIPKAQHYKKRGWTAASLGTFV